MSRRGQDPARLSRSAGTQRAFAVVFGALGGIVLFGGAVVFGLSVFGLPALWDGFPTILRIAGGVVGGGAMGLGLIGVLSSRRAGGKARTLSATADELRMFTAVRARVEGVTVDEAASLARVRVPEADAVLTGLAKRGMLDMDVDGEGVIRYRVQPTRGDVIAEASVERGDRVGQDQDLDQ